MTDLSEVNYVQSNAQMILSLPDPDTEWKMKHEEVDIEHADLQRLSHRGIIERLTPDCERPHVWRVKERPYNQAKEYFENTDRFECCGSRGVTNDDGQLKCMNCGASISEAEFKAVLSGTW